MGCDYLQGWMFGRAMPIDAFMPLRQAVQPPWLVAA
jgi:EAL domain-containing protein (putative c-di-GMP-specific phosphodiesterase class I)